MPEVGEQDVFELGYMAKLRALLAQHGVPVEYPVDRAAIDTGVHLFSVSGEKVTTSHTRVWFQAKGKRAGTLSAYAIAQAERIAEPLAVEQLRYWYAAPEPVYLVLYLESWSGSSPRTCETSLNGNGRGTRSTVRSRRRRSR